MEHKVAKDSGVCIVSKFDGIVERAAANEIWLRRQEMVDGKLVSGNIVKYKLTNLCVLTKVRASINVRLSKKAIG